MMTIGLIFWILFIVGFVFHVCYRDRAVESLLWWVLTALLGIEVFGFPIK